MKCVGVTCWNALLQLRNEGTHVVARGGGQMARGRDLDDLLFQKLSSLNCTLVSVSCVISAILAVTLECGLKSTARTGAATAHYWLKGRWVPKTACCWKALISDISSAMNDMR